MKKITLPFLLIALVLAACVPANQTDCNPDRLNTQACGQIDHRNGGENRVKSVAPAPDTKPDPKPDPKPDTKPNPKDPDHKDHDGDGKGKLH